MLFTFEIKTQKISIVISIVKEQQIKMTWIGGVQILGYGLVATVFHVFKHLYTGNIVLFYFADETEKVVSLRTLSACLDLLSSHDLRAHVTSSGLLNRLIVSFLQAFQLDAAAVTLIEDNPKTSTGAILN